MRLHENPRQANINIRTEQLELRPNVCYTLVDWCTAMVVRECGVNLSGTCGICECLISQSKHEGSGAGVPDCTCAGVTSFIS